MAAKERTKENCRCFDAVRGCARGATVERSETGERTMIAPAGQSTARAGLRSKLAALVVRRQAPPNPRCRKQQSVGAGHARPATSPPPAVNLPPPTHSPKPPDPATLLPPTPIICARQPPSPQYTPCPNFSLKLCRKNQKNLQKPVDKGHTTCYNNQAVSRAQPAAAAAGAFTYSLYAVF